MKTISVIGLGYVGLPLLVALEESGNFQVKGYDIDKVKVSAIQNGENPIDEKQIDHYIKTHKLNVSTKSGIMEGTDVFIVCVPTPVDDKKPDLSPLMKSLETVAKFMDGDELVIIESTIYPGVCDEKIVPFFESKGFENLKLAHCPERINPGNEKWGVGNIPRVVGANCLEALEEATAIYEGFLDSEVHRCDNLKEAEAAKIIENAFRDVNIAFVNELALSFDKLGINLPNVLKAASTKPFGFMPFFPGCGVGGHCIPVDPYYLIERARKGGFNHKFLKLARSINEKMPEHTVGMLSDVVEPPAKVGVLGIAYKGGVKDKRESPAVEIIGLLKEAGYEVITHDPYLLEESSAETIEDLVREVDALVIATEHIVFKDLSAKFCAENDIKAVIDGRNLLNPKKFRELGIHYKGIGV